MKSIFLHQRNTSQNGSPERAYSIDSRHSSAGVQDRSKSVSPDFNNRATFNTLKMKPNHTSIDVSKVRPKIEEPSEVYKI